MCAIAWIKDHADNNLMHAMLPLTNTAEACRMTISTVGVPNSISQLAQKGLQATLAVSLHAPDQALREQIIPRWAWLTHSMPGPSL